MPIVLVCGALAYRDLVQRREPLEDHWFNAAVAASALISAVVAIAVVKIIHSLGLFGASFNARGPGIGTLFDLLHLVGVVPAAWALFSVIRQFFSCDDLIAQILTVAIPVQLALYGFSTLPYDAWQAHDIAVVLPFGAVLAGRVLAERLTKARLLPLLAVVAFGYLVALGHGVVQKQVPAHDQALGPWLRAPPHRRFFRLFRRRCHRANLGSTTALREFRGLDPQIRSPRFHSSRPGNSRVRPASPHLLRPGLDHHGLEQEPAARD